MTALELALLNIGLSVGLVALLIALMRTGR